MLALALASYLSLYPALLLPPLLLLCYDRYEQIAKASASPSSPVIIWISIFFGGVGLLLLMSYLVTGASWEFLPATYGVQLLLPDLTPNVGLWWYFFIEMFDSFREFFLGVFWLHLGGYVSGLCIRVRKQPLFALTTMIGIFAIFKPYPSISDASLYFALLPLYRHVFPCKWKGEAVSWPPTDTGSNAVHILHGRNPPIRDSPRTRLLLSLDICRFGQR